MVAKIFSKKDFFFSSKSLKNYVPSKVAYNPTRPKVFSPANWDSFIVWNCLMFEVVKLCRMKNILKLIRCRYNSMPLRNTLFFILGKNLISIANAAKFVSKWMTFFLRNFWGITQLCRLKINYLFAVHVCQIHFKNLSMTSEKTLGYLNGNKYFKRSNLELRFEIWTQS